jgi:hypothetical protein
LQFAIFLLENLPCSTEYYGNRWGELIAAALIKPLAHDFRYPPISRRRVKQGALRKTQQIPRRIAKNYCGVQENKLSAFAGAK